MMVNRYECPCEKTSVDALTLEGSMTCPRCGNELEFVGKVGCVRGLTEGQTLNSVLRELADDWRDQGTGNADWNQYNEGVHETLRAAADELEEVIDVGE